MTRRPTRARVRPKPTIEELMQVGLVIRGSEFLSRPQPQRPFPASRPTTKKPFTAGCGHTGDTS